MFPARIQSIFLVLCLLMLPATGLPALSDADYEAIEEYETGFMELLAGIHNRESADEAARAIATHPHAATAVKVLHPQWWTDGDDNTPLVKAYFHGSAALAETLGFQAEDALLPTPLTPEAKAQIQKGLLRNLTKPGNRQEAESLVAQNKGLRPDLLTPIPRQVAKCLSGGCGFSPEYAWVVHTDSYQESRFVATQLISYGFSGIHKSMQRIEFRGIRRFMVFNVSLLQEGKKYEVEQWFDISAHAHVYPEAMRQQASNDLREHARQLHHALFCVCDAESAHEQDSIIAALYEKCQQAARICEERQSLWDLWMNAFEIPDRERLAFHIMDMEKAGAYGSDSLLRLAEKLRHPLYQ